MRIQARAPAGPAPASGRLPGGPGLKIDPDRYRGLFLEEAKEHVEALTDGLIKLEQGFDAHVVDTLFRAAHSMKGMAATLGFTAEADLAHALEDHLTHLRDRRIAPARTVGLLVDAVDILAAAVDAIAGTHTGPDLAAMTARLRGAHADADAEAQPLRYVPEDEDIVGHLRAAAERLPAEGRVTLQIRLSDRCVAPKARLLVIERTLGLSGTVGHVDPPRDAWSGLLAAEGIMFHAILHGVHDVDALVDRIRRVPDIEDVRVVDLAVGEPRRAPAGARPQAPTVRIPVERIDRLLDRAGEVRIALAQLDRLLADHFLGERPYALTESMIRLEREAKDLHDDALALRTLPVSVVTRRFTRLVRDTAQTLGKDVRLVIEGEDTEVDRSVLEALADPVMHLVKNAVGHGVEAPAVRGASGKDPTATVAIRFTRVPNGIEVVVSDDGAGIDRDRVLKRAIEAGHLAAGTSPQSLTDEQVFALLTRPGFSTAAAVTDVSGRGVGLDVVQERLNAIGGSIRLRSSAGVGTTVRLTLPPTLALIEALECRVDGDPYYVPVESIVTTVRLGPGHRTDGRVTFRDTRAEVRPATDAGAQHDAAIAIDETPEVYRSVRVVDLDAVLGVRARRVPYVVQTAPAPRRAEPAGVRRGEGPSLTAAETSTDTSSYGVIVEKHGHLACVAVDAFGTIHELVVKAVDLPGGGPRYVSGAAIRPDGRVGLLLDVPSLLGAGLLAPAPSPASR